MAKTVASGTASYCSVAQFLKWYDARTIGDLVADDGTRVAAGSLAANDVLAQMLQAASGMLEAACLLGHRYEIADLQSLQAPLMTNAGVWLARIVAALAFEDVLRRRPNPDLSVPKEVDAARRALEALANGELIFAFTETQDAGVLESDEESPTDVDNKAMVSWYARDFFGRRTNRIERLS